MSAFMLIRTEGPFPPGGFTFHDTVTGKQYLDNHTTFANRVAEVIRDRKANQRLVSDPKQLEIPFVAVEISQFICARLGNSPRWCSDGSQPVGRVVRASATPTQTATDIACKFCGAKSVTQAICLTCGGGRVTYSCGECLRKWR